MLNQRLLYRVLTAAAAACLTAGATAYAAPANYTCSGGSIPSGIYSNLTVGGACTIDTGSNGSVVVLRNLTVLTNASLQAITGSINGTGSTAPLAPDLTVGGDLVVQPGGVLDIGCGGVPYPCANDPNPAAPTYNTQITVAGSLIAIGALAVVVHHTGILGSLVISGGGGGVACNFNPLLGAPNYDDVEDVQVAGDLVVTGVNSCWTGMFRDTVGRNVVWRNNTNADPDGNEIAHNTVVGRLDCRGNSPANQTGDSLGGPNTVLNHGWDFAPGRPPGGNQCAGLIVH